MIHLFLKKRLLGILVLALLVIVGQASAQSVSLKHVPGAGGTEGIVSGQGTQIVVAVSQTGITQSVNAIQIVFDFDQSLLSLAAPSGWLLSGGNTATLLAVTAARVPASISFTFTTKVDVTGRKFSIGIKSVTLDAVTLTPSATIAFNSVRPRLHLDTQIESPAQNNNALTLPEKSAGDALQFQLFAPTMAGSQFNAIQLELSLQGKRLSSYISSNMSGGWLSRVSGSGHLSLTQLAITPVSVPSSGYLGQVDLKATDALTSSDRLIVRQASLDTRQLDVSGAVITFVQAAAAPCPGDFDGNGMVNVADFLAFVQVFGTSTGDATYNALMDMDSSGSIGVADFLAFVRVFGTTCAQPPSGGGRGGSPDLIVESPSVNDNTLTAGQSFTLQATVRNQGTGQSVATTLRYYQSVDATISSSDRQVGSSSVGILTASGSSIKSISLTAPSSAGTYYYGACVASVSGESNTNNNCSPAVTVTVNAVPPPADRAALVALYNATNGPNWSNNTNWLSAAPLNQWHGVRTDANGRVTRLDLSTNRLSGSLPSSLGNLTNLEVLWLYDNQLSGSLPSSLGNLTNLEVLDLSSNQLSGSIPSELGRLTKLEWLGLYENQLSGSLPSSLGNLTNLEGLGLASNQLSGSIPSELGRLTNLEVLDLSTNRLSGSLPSSLGNLTNLEGLDLSSNQLSGSIPSELGRLTNLEVLALSSNQLSGSIPSELGRLTNLTTLYLSFNSLSNVSALSGLTNLTELYLSGTSLSNVSALSNLTNLTTLYLSFNSLSDVSALSGLTNLEYLSLSRTSLSNVSALSNLTNLRLLWLNDNSISDIAPLVANTGLGSGDQVDVRNNPLSATSLNTHIPALQNRGVVVRFGGASKPATEEEERGMIAGDLEARNLIHHLTGGSRELAP